MTDNEKIILHELVDRCSVCAEMFHEHVCQHDGTWLLNERASGAVKAAEVALAGAYQAVAAMEGDQE